MPNAQFTCQASELSNLSEAKLVNEDFYQRGAWFMGLNDDLDVGVSRCACIVITTCNKYEIEKLVYDMLAIGIV